MGLGPVGSFKKMIFVSSVRAANRDILVPRRSSSANGSPSRLVRRVGELENLVALAQVAVVLVQQPMALTDPSCETIQQSLLAVPC